MHVQPYHKVKQRWEGPADWILTLTRGRPGAGWFELLHITVYSALQPPSDCNLSFMCLCMCPCSLYCSLRIPVSTLWVRCIFTDIGSNVVLVSTYTGGWLSPYPCFQSSFLIVTRAVHYLHENNTLKVNKFLAAFSCRCCCYMSRDDSSTHMTACLIVPFSLPFAKLQLSACMWSSPRYQPLHCRGRCSQNT